MNRLHYRLQQMELVVISDVAGVNLKLSVDLIAPQSLEKCIRYNMSLTLS